MSSSESSESELYLCIVCCFVTVSIIYHLLPLLHVRTDADDIEVWEEDAAPLRVACLYHLLF